GYEGTHLEQCIKTRSTDSGGVMQELALTWRPVLFTVVTVAVSLLVSNCMETTQTNQTGETSMGAVDPGQRASATALARDRARQPVTGSADAGADLRTDYKISPQDILQIAVFQIKDLDSAVQVGEDGNIALPLVGKVQVRGKTTYDAEQTIAGKLREKY